MSQEEKEMKYTLAFHAEGKNWKLKNFVKNKSSCNFDPIFDPDRSIGHRFNGNNRFSGQIVQKTPTILEED